MGRLRLALVLAALACVVIPPAHAHAGKKMEVALQDDDVFYWRTNFSRTKAFKRAADLRVSWIRVNVAWARAVKHSFRKHPPKHVHFSFKRADSIVNAALRHGVEVEICLTGPAPAWATGNHKRGPRRPGPKRYARFVRAAARHFKGRVWRYSIWNEPNHISWLAPKRAQASLYRKLYSRGYRQIKHVDPRIKVLIGETAPYASKPYRATPPLLFLRKLTCVNRRYKRTRKCAPLFADGWAHHPYEYLHSPRHPFPGRDNVTMRGLPKLVHALNKVAARGRLRTPHTKRRLNIYLTEFGYFSHGKRKYMVSAKKRASYLRTAFEMARRMKRVKQMLQYMLVRPGRRQIDSWDTSIVGRSGKPGRSYKKLRGWAHKWARRHKLTLPFKPRHKPRH